MSAIRYNSDSFGEQFPRRRRRATPRQAGGFRNNRFYSEAEDASDGISVLPVFEPAPEPAPEPVAEPEQAPEPEPVPDPEKAVAPAAPAPVPSEEPQEPSPAPDLAEDPDDDFSKQPTADLGEPLKLEDEPGQLEPEAADPSQTAELVLEPEAPIEPATPEEPTPEAPTAPAEPEAPLGGRTELIPQLANDMTQPVSIMASDSVRIDNEVPRIDPGAPSDAGLFELNLDPVDMDLFSTYGTEATDFAEADFTPFPAPAPELIAADADADAEAGAYRPAYSQAAVDGDENGEPPVQGSFGYVENGFESADPLAGDESPRHRSSIAGVVFGILAMIVLAGAIGAWMWSNRTIEVTVNGQPISAKPDQALSEVYNPADAHLKPADLVSLSGNVITQGAGDPYVVTINGETVTPAEASSHKLQSNDVIVYSEAEDVVEDYVAQPFEVTPKLVADGDAGSLAYVSQWGYVGTSEVRTGKKSGEQVTVEVEPVRDLVITQLNPAPADDQKLIALTFDDGPSEYTSQILDLLDQYGAKATFFEAGEQLEYYPELAQAVVSRGHQLASKGYYNQNFTQLSAESLLAEIDGGYNTIRTATSVETAVVRPPFGAMLPSTWLGTLGHMSAAVFWNIDSNDENFPGSAVIAQNVTEAAYNGAIVLMHDGGADRSQTVAALETILPTLKSQGYTFVTINELMAADKRIPAEIAAGNMLLPAGSFWPTETTYVAPEQPVVEESYDSDYSEDYSWYDDSSEYYDEYDYDYEDYE